jgi:hypothetical protein
LVAGIRRGKFYYFYIGNNFKNFLN